jgi:hypothetical protein
VTGVRETFPRGLRLDGGTDLQPDSYRALRSLLSRSWNRSVPWMVEASSPSSITAREPMEWIIALPLLAVTFVCASIPVLIDSGRSH